MNKLKLFIILLVILGVGSGIVIKLKSKKEKGEVTKEIVLAAGFIRTIISTTGTVLPKNRLEIKPPVNGRIESILVKEGEKVKKGQTLAWMSSTERAALLDAAQGQGEEQLKYWQETYKPIPLLAPIDAEVIVATVQPGQTVTSADAVVVLSDQLIVRAQVDETDIGKVKLGQDAVVSLDAYPEASIRSVVGHIYYESETVNNVTIYKVDVIPQEASPYFRSGMNATIDFIIQSKDNVLLIPLEAVQKDNDEVFCFVKPKNGGEPVKTQLKLGISDDKYSEVASGVSLSDTVIVKAKKYSLPKSSAGSNPFMPGRR